MTENFEKKIDYFSWMITLNPIGPMTNTMVDEVKDFIDEKSQVKMWAYCVEHTNTDNQHMHAIVISTTKNFRKMLKNFCVKLWPEEFKIENVSIVCKECYKANPDADSEYKSAMEYLEKDGQAWTSASWTEDYDDYLHENKDAKDRRKRDLTGLKKYADLIWENKLPHGSWREVMRSLEHLAYVLYLIKLPSMDKYITFIADLWLYMCQDGLGQDRVIIHGLIRAELNTEIKKIQLQKNHEVKKEAKRLLGIERQLEHAKRRKLEEDTRLCNGSENMKFLLKCADR